LDRKNSEEFKIISTDLMNSGKSDSTSAYTFETNPEFNVTFTKTSETVGYFDYIEH